MWFTKEMKGTSPLVLCGKVMYVILPKKNINFDDFKEIILIKVL